MFGFFDDVLPRAPQSRLSIEEMVQININADTAEIQKPIAMAPFILESHSTLIFDGASQQFNFWFR